MEEPSPGRSNLVGATERKLQAARTRYSAPGEGWATIGAVVLAVVAIVGFFEFATATDADTWVPVLVGLSLVLISLPICSWLAGSPRDQRLRRLLILLLVVKIFMAGPRYYLAEGYYEGEGDSGRYHQAGAFLVVNMEEGNWTIEPAELTAFPRETRVVGYFVGVLYLLFGPTYFGGFLLFSWISWIGLMFFLRAFQVAFPNAPPYFLVKLMFLPSLLFWSSSLGKEALMVFLIGILTLGVAHILENRRLPIGLSLVVAGGLAMLQVRPHLLLICAVALALSTLAKPGGGTAARGMVVRGLVLVLAVPLLIVGMEGLDTVFRGNEAGIQASLDETVRRTEVGGSAFETRPVRGPQDVPNALITVLYRPFLFEASSVPVLIAAIEGTMLAILTIASARWIWKVGPAMFRSGFAAYCGAWVFCFVVAFSNIGNAGILARQRVQMFPLLVLVVAVARYRHELELAAEQAPELPDVHIPEGSGNNGADRLPVRTATLA